MLTPPRRAVLRAPLLATTGIALALALGSCGDDEPQGAGPTTPGATESTPQERTDANTDTATEAVEGDGTWLDYMAVSEGRVCGTAAEVQGMKVKGTTRIHDVDTSGATKKFVISTEGELDGKANPAMSMEIPYEMAPDGTLSAAVNFPQNAGFDVEMDGKMTMPSIDGLKSGKSTTSTVTGVMKAQDAAVQKDLVSKLKPGADGMQLKMTLKVSPAKQRAKITTPAGTFTDVVGTDVAFTELSITNGASKEIDAIEQGIRAGLTGAPTTTYYARGEGQVEAVAVGTPVQLTGCEG